MDHAITQFKAGAHNVQDDENIPKDAAQAVKNWVTKSGRIVLAYGRNLIGAEGAAGKVYALHFGFKADGTKIMYRKISTKIQYLSGTTWTDVITGLTEAAEYTFANYTSLSGSFTFAAGIDGIFKINNAHPGSYLSLYDAAKNDKGKILIDKGRMLLWDCANASKTTLKLSWIDGQDGDVYTTVSAEVLGASPTQHFTGTLGAKTATRNVFGLVVTGLTGGTAETFTDNKDGTLTSNKGGTGTINYTSGVYDITFSAALSAGNAAVDYQWEDSNVKGVTDFTFSSTRVAGEGNRITQDRGGSKILSVLVGPDGAYYSLKEQSSYRLAIAVDDTTFDNNIFREDMGLPFFRAAVSSSRGIVFMNTASPEHPQMSILQKNPLGDNLDLIPLFEHFDFSVYDVSDCSIDTYDRFILVACKSSGVTNNDTLLLCNMANPFLDKQGNKGYTQTVDVTGYATRMFARDSGNLYAGSPITASVYQLFNGFDDDGNPLENFWIGKGEQYAPIAERLKKFKKLRLKGLIDPDQSYEVYVSYDDDDFSLVGTVSGKGDYVDASSPQTVGSNMVGETQVGGDDTVLAYPYFCELKIKTPKFRKRTLKLVALGIGYVDVDTLMDWNILPFEEQIPSRFRSKQNVSLAGVPNQT